MFRNYSSLDAMELLLQRIIENWLAIVIIAVVVIGASTAYLAFLRGIERRVTKAWLEVYETFLARADKAPLLVELIREGAALDGAPSYESLLEELISARAATAGMPLPTEQKRIAEKNFEAVLTRVIGEISQQPAFKKNAHLLALLQEFSAWDSQVQFSILGYTRTLRLYRSFSLGSMPGGYIPFEY